VEKIMHDLADMEVLATGAPRPGRAIVRKNARRGVGEKRA
jgi:hypothetical protein